ncbi:MAG: OmpA family protein [Planctomycetota bacterium]
MNIHRILRRASVAALVLPTLAGCATLESVQEYQDEIAALRENSSKLQRENNRLRDQLANAEARLVEANMRVEDALARPDLSELENIGVGVDVRGNALVLSLPGSITFPSGSATLNGQGEDTVRAVARVLETEYSNSEYWIEGHTDSQQPSRSSFDSNRALSVARAMSVLQFLVNKCGVPDENCVVAGHGEYNPLQSNATPSGMAQNRRVEIIVQQPRG